MDRKAEVIEAIRGCFCNQENGEICDYYVLSCAMMRRVSAKVSKKLFLHDFLTKELKTYNLEIWYTDFGLLSVIKAKHPFSELLKQIIPYFYFT